jgi:hypothetical protein
LPHFTKKHRFLCQQAQPLLAGTGVFQPDI